MRPISLEGKLACLLGACVLLGAASAAALSVALGSPWLAIPISVLLSILPLLWLAKLAADPVTRLMRSMTAIVASYRDGDFSISLATARRDELGDLMRQHDELGHALRQQRQHLAERELLLDTVVQNTPVALVLSDPSHRVVLANLAARHLFNQGTSLAGLDFFEVMAKAPEPLRNAVEGGEDALVSVELEGGEEVFHVSRRGFRLHGRPHWLYLFRRMTRELSRQEVATWKKVIRVISHELNNSLAPISSLAHSGAELANRGQLERMPQIFATIGERARHLHGFVAGYASFAKLPAPRLEMLPWSELIARLQPQCGFQLIGAPPTAAVAVDIAQFGQALINLCKNAVEAGSPPEQVEFEVQAVHGNWRLELRDRGSGMSETVLANALLPFYSTKRSGSGLGLALVREIVEAHGGRLQLANREGGGLSVTMLLPMASARS
jgi:nitrogen fixation/metabolism regulation signal transduction histidine kinase